ncbi:hypothetical protein B0H14DRAFT_3510662 [Mycena olivaceomarginata]|nr:hypothetical protein B0H14DRAFT_3510662 [Mycena olivaceomarginata]
MSSHPVCKIPFEPNPENYKSDAEHDANARKHWYLVLGVGLFTKKTDADALRRWKQHCSRHHTANVHRNPRPDDREDDEGVDAVAALGGRVLPRAHSAAPSVPHRTRSVAHAASTRTGYYVSPEEVDRWSKTRLSNGAGVSSAAKRRREGSASVVLPVNGERQLGNGAGVSSAVKRRREGSASVGLSVNGERGSSVKRETLASPVKRERQPSVKREQVPLYADMSDSELTDDSPQDDSALADDMPPLLYDVEAEDVPMPHASPVAISPTVSTTSSLSSDSSGSRESISGASPAAPEMGPAGLSRLSALGAGAPAAASAFVGLGESISDAHPAAARMGAAGGSRISALALGAGALGASTSARSVCLLLNSATRKLYPDPIQAFAEVMPGESLQVIAQEEVVEYCAGQSARLGT